MKFIEPQDDIVSEILAALNCGEQVTECHLDIAVDDVVRVRIERFAEGEELRQLLRVIENRKLTTICEPEDREVKPVGRET